VVLAETTFLDVFWYSIVFFIWVMAIWLFIALIGDVIRRNDLSGWAKGAWIFFMVVLPVLGCIAYIIARPKVTAQDVRMMAQSEAAYRAADSVSTADELTKLSELRVQGVLSEQEYEELKRKTLATV
jgi:Phospholipase_D-nuclease N-terminal/Short C-terminal domain